MRLKPLALLIPLALVACKKSADLSPEDITGPLYGDLLIASGDVTFESALVWARAPGEAWLQVEVMNHGRGLRWLSEPVRVTAETDFATTIQVDNLPPLTRLDYNVVAVPAGEAEEPPWDFHASPPSGSLTAVGHFSTAPRTSDSNGVSIIVGGDLGGQGWCRPPEEGYRVFKAMTALEPDLFLANGDMIYADDECPALAPDERENVRGDFLSVADARVDWTDASLTREAIFAHWRYNRSDKHQQRFLAETPMVAQWDDHEVINDFGASWDAHSAHRKRAGYPTLVEAGQDAFFAWNPITPNADEPRRIYRSLRWGRHAELFVVDARSYRDKNSAVAGASRTLLGAEQRDWLVASLKASTATWKVVSVDVPISIPTGSKPWRHGRDGWANGEGANPPEGRGDRSMQTGYESELAAILATLDRADLEGVVFVTTDVHFAQTIRYDVDADGDGDDFTFYEFVVGPLRAWQGEPGPLDPTFGPTSLYAEGGHNGFGRLKITPTPDGRSADLRYEHFDDYGRLRDGSVLELSAR